MRKIIKCVGILFLSLFLVINFPVEITAAEGDVHTYGDFVYKETTFNNVTLIGIKSGVTNIVNPTIPTTFIATDGLTKKVNTIEEAVFKNNTNLTGTLTIGTNVLSIKTSAFEGCTGLTNIVGINSSSKLKSISRSAFKGCKNMVGNLEFPNTLESIGSSAFEGCSSLTGGLTIPNTVTTLGTSAFDGCGGFNGNLNLSNLNAAITTMPNYIFRDCSGFTGALTIPNTVKNINLGAFDGCSNFDGNLSFSNTLVSIGDYAFRGCSKLKLSGGLTIPNTVTTLVSKLLMVAQALLVI